MATRGPAYAARRGMLPGTAALDRLLEDFLPPHLPAVPRVGLLPAMPLEILSEGDEFVVRAQVPGLAKDDIDISVDDGTLVLRATRDERRDEKAGTYWYSEVRRGMATRRVRIPEGVAAGDIRADLRDGVLEVRMPVPEESKEPAAVRVPIGGPEPAAAIPEGPVAAEGKPEM